VKRQKPAARPQQACPTRRDTMSNKSISENHTDVNPLVDEAAERAMIGAALIDPGILDSTTLKSNQFGVFGDLWSKIVDQHARGIRPDMITLATDVSEFIDSCPSCVSWAAYQDIIQGFARRRKLLAAAQEFGKAVYAEEQADHLKFASELLKEAMTTSSVWERRTLADGRERRDPVRYVIDGLIERPSLNVVYGAPGTLKSMLLADMCVCVASGIDWLPEKLGGDGTKVECVPTLWVDLDNGVRRTDERMVALADSRSLHNDTEFYYVSMPSPWLDASDPTCINSLIEMCLADEIGVLVIDNLGVVATCDENNAEMAQVMGNFRRVAEECNCAVILVHHRRKSNGIRGRLGETLRGHSSIEASLDLALLVRRDDDETNRINVTCTKARGVEIRPFGAQFEFTHKGNSNELAFCHFLGFRVQSRAEIANDAIRSTVGASPGINAGDLVRAVVDDTGFGINFIRDCINWLVKHDHIRIESGERGARQHYLCTQ
jgi:hypothetical protein